MRQEKQRDMMAMRTIKQSQNQIEKPQEKQQKTNKKQKMAAAVTAATETAPLRPSAPPVNKTGVNGKRDLKAIYTCFPSICPIERTSSA